MAPLLSGYMIQYSDYVFLNAIKMKNARTFGASFYEALLYYFFFKYINVYIHCKIQTANSSWKGSMHVAIGKTVSKNTYVVQSELQLQKKIKKIKESPRPVLLGILIGRNFICSVKEHVSWVTRMWGLSANLWQGGMWCTNRIQRV